MMRQMQRGVDAWTHVAARGQISTSYIQLSSVKIQ